MRSTLNRARGQAPDQVFLHKEEHDHHRDRPDERGRGKQPPFHLIRTIREGLQTDGKGIILRALQHDPRQHEFVESGHKTEYENDGQDRRRKRQDDPVKRLKTSGAVYQRRFFDLIRDRVEVPFQQPHVKR